MIKATIRISNKLGLHARASAKLSKLAVMMLAAGLGSEVDVETEGADEAAAMAALTALIDDKFGEGQ